MMVPSTPPAAKFLVALALVASASPARAQGDAGAADASDTSAPAPAPAPAAAAPEAPAETLSAPTATTKPVTPPTETVAIAPPGAGDAVEVPPSSWFTRQPLALTLGQGDEQWSLTFYGFIEANYIIDTTRSYDERIGSSLVARDDTFDGRHGRTQFSIRNSRFGMKFQSPTSGAFRPSAVLEADFYGPKPAYEAKTPEHDYFDAAMFRIRHAYFSLESDYIDVLAGQTYNVFGWQNFRSTQFRLSRNFGAATGPVSVMLAASVARPAQRDSTVPDGNAGLRLNVNHWRGMITTTAASGSLSQPMFFQVSGVGRQYKVDAFTPPPTQKANSATAWGISIDALVPVLPANDAGDRGNSLTLTGSFVKGTGIGDLINSHGGAEFPVLPNPAQTNPAPEYEPNIDRGLVSFDNRGILHTIDWQAIKVGIQYYFPGSGRLFVTANYSQAHSANLRKLFPRGGAEIELLGYVADSTMSGDASLYWDATPAVRFGVTGAYTRVRYLDGNEPHNLRGMALAQYAF
jgi:hypothetical protein